MKDQEERELNGEVTLSEVSPVKQPGEGANDGEGAGRSDASGMEQDAIQPSSTTDGDPDGEGTTDNSLQTKESQSFDTAQGALGQVKAKVEVCKDESIGKNFWSDRLMKSHFN